MAMKWEKVGSISHTATIGCVQVGYVVEQVDGTFYWKVELLKLLGNYGVSSSLEGAKRALSTFWFNFLRRADAIPRHAVNNRHTEPISGNN